MKILKLRMENFQGVKEFEIEPQGESCSVYGDNGTGKTSIYNAFTWLMYGKPSTAEKNYSPKTTGTHNLHHIVEMTVQLDDGTVITLKKDFHEVYKTMKGSAQAVLSGHTTDYSVDGVPTNETQFKKTLVGIYHYEELAKMLTLYDYFLDTMKIADRRKVLLQVCGDVEMTEVIEHTPELKSLPALLKKPGNGNAFYTVEEYQAIATKERNLTDKELKNIPNRIDEAEKAKPDVAVMDAEVIDNAIKAIKDKQRKLENQRAADENVVSTTIRQKISELESQRAADESRHTRAEVEKNKEAYENISNLRYMKADIETVIMKKQQECRTHENEIIRLNSKREALLKEWQEENKKEWSGVEICPTCNRPLPLEDIEKAKEAFNIAKSQRLEDINQKGMNQCNSSMIKAEQEEIVRLNEEIKEKEKEKSEIEKNIAVAESTVITTVEYNTTEDYKVFTQQIEDLKEKLKDLSAVAVEADNLLIGKLRELDADLDNEIRKKAAIELMIKQDLRIESLKEQEKELATKYEQLQAGIHLCEVYTRAKAQMLDEKINKRFKTLRFRLFIEQQNGGIADDCEALIPCAAGLVPFKSANNAARINAGLELIDTLAECYGVHMPVFLDNSESVTKVRKTGTQLIKLVVSSTDKVLRFKKGDC